jgi:hypothetical protein
MYRKEVKFYRNTLDEAVDFAKSQLEACRDLLIKIYFERA